MESEFVFMCIGIASSIVGITSLYQDTKKLEEMSKILKEMVNTLDKIERNK